MAKDTQETTTDSAPAPQKDTGETTPAAGSLAKAQNDLKALVTRLNNIREELTEDSDAAHNFRSRTGLALYELDQASQGA